MQEKPSEQYLQLAGSVEEIIFRNEDTGFTVLNLTSAAGTETVVGEFSGVEAGEELVLTGRYVSHPTYGYQFKSEIYERRLPASAHAIEKYLASGVIKGIGPALAKRMVERFGDDTLEIIEHAPERLAEVKGITKAKSAELAVEFQQLFGVRAVMLFLAKYGVPATQSIRVWKRWGVTAVDNIRENPYCLCSASLGIDFALADSIAMQLGFALDSPCRIEAGFVYVLEKNLDNGHTCLPQERLIAVAAGLLELPLDTVEPVLPELLETGRLYAVDRDKPYLYLPTMLEAESYICSRITLMISQPPQEAENLDTVIGLLEEECGIQYADLQRRAIREAICNNIFILTGGPGTGKTTTLNGIISLLEQQGKKVLIAAPTGRAAKRISEVTGREAKTIHRLLEVEFGDGDRMSFSRNEKKLLDCDVVVVDEMSMVDTLLFDSLLRAMKLTCRLILVGDSDQLPSVGAGNILKDLIDSGVLPVVQLTEIFRQAAQSLIVTNAHEIVAGRVPDLEQKDNDFFFMARQNPEAARELVVSLCQDRLPKSYGFDTLEDIQVLCPSRKGELGVVSLNIRLQEALNPSSGKNELKSGLYTYRIGDKVMQIRNNYDMEWTRGDEEGRGIFNGDIGIIRAIDKAGGVLTIDFDGRMAEYASEMTSELELAYAVTIHKSQGSEYPAVILPILGGYDKLYFRNLLYTAVTRAKKLLVIVGSKARVEYMVHNNRKMLRYTGLRYFLENGIS